MLFSQYLAIETRAGGAGCTNVEFIRSAHKSLFPAARSRSYRADRHAWLRKGLKFKARTDAIKPTGGF